MHVADADSVKLLLTCEHDLVQGTALKQEMQASLCSAVQALLSANALAFLSLCFASCT